MMTNILVAIDGSSESHKAVEIAADLSARRNARVTLLYVLRYLGDGPNPNEARARSLLEREVEYLEEKGLLKTTSHVAVGDPAQVITDFAAAQGIDMIVMGSRGRSDLDNLLNGSVSQEVARSSPCTCVVVR